MPISSLDLCPRFLKPVSKGLPFFPSWKEALKGGLGAFGFQLLLARSHWRDYFSGGKTKGFWSQNLPWRPFLERGLLEGWPFGLLVPEKGTLWGAFSQQIPFFPGPNWFSKKAPFWKLFLPGQLGAPRGKFLPLGPQKGPISRGFSRKGFQGGFPKGFGFGAWNSTAFLGQRVFFGAPWLETEVGSKFGSNGPTFLGGIWGKTLGLGPTIPQKNNWAPFSLLVIFQGQFWATFLARKPLFGGGRAIKGRHFGPKGFGPIGSRGFLCPLKVEDLI